MSDVLDGSARQSSAGPPTVEPDVDQGSPTGAEVGKVTSPPRAGDARLRKFASRSAPRWEVEARQRIREAIRDYTRPLADLIGRDANEGDTRLLVTDFLGDVLGYDRYDILGYDRYDDLTTDDRSRGEHTGLGLRIDRRLVAVVEVKRCTTRLNVRHLRQVEMYAAGEGVEWMILTNGQVWQIWHLTAVLPVAIDLALEVDLLSNDSPSVKADGLFFLAKESLKRRQIDDLWRAKAATAPRALGEVLVSDAVLDEIRRELRRRTGHNVGPKDLRELLLNNVVRPEVLAP